MFNSVLGQITPNEGAIELNGQNITGLSPLELSRRGVGRTFQTLQVFGKMTVRDNLIVAAQEHKGSMEAIADGALQRWFTPEFRADEAGGGKLRVAALRERLVNTDAAAYAASCKAVAGIDFRAGNGGIQCPALVIAGTRDEATPVAMSEAICKSIPGAQLQTLPAAHLSAVEQPAAFAALLERFFESQG